MTLHALTKTAFRSSSTQIARMMSVYGPSESGHPSTSLRKKVTIQALQSMKEKRTPMSMLTAYDYPSALACSSNPLIDITLVGDSLAQVCLGYNSTTELSLSEMIHHARAVARGTTHPFIVADMPFGSYQISIEDTARNAVKLIQEGRVEGLKLEGGSEIRDTVRKLSGLGIPVMAHVGLLPQRHVAMSGYRVQGKDVDSARKIINDALALEEAGAFSIVLEAIPKELAAYVTQRLRIPTIGIGAGSQTDGQVSRSYLPITLCRWHPQVLVWDDMMGTWAGHKAKFVRRFGDLKTERDSAIQKYAEAVKLRTFPDDSESYTMDKMAWEEVSRIME
ncbi:3-methyl-2-oxobutanoate hydroxymethyltransferase PanB [Lentinula boryana]|uniref:3-methyl-2-oxobutanoate hydroxymethyltransferase n=1 Tax=Lentinula boryana TaxID=40481 RepID=A0ABQ8QSZ2_9AGAR|nr:3-methyl-2-oxobutanoate hydroxymethyltransferase PanB [Lentinula boryana]